MTPIIEVKNLSKHYPRGVTAVGGVEFAVMAGECFGLLGPNGAGKTTTVEIMEGITQPSAGTVLYLGEPLGERFRQEAGILFQRTALQEFITVGETLRLFAALYRNPMPLAEVIELCSLDDLLSRDTRKLSGGQRQRVLLGLALINDPRLVFLDEPTTGLDPQARRNFWQLVDGIKARGKTVILTTHYMEEAYTLCDRLAIMDHGQIIAAGTPDGLLREHFSESVVRLPLEDIEPQLGQLALDYAANTGYAEVLTHDVNATLAHLLAAGVALQRLQIRQPNLEDLFIALTGEQLRA